MFAIMGGGVVLIAVVILADEVRTVTLVESGRVVAVVMPEVVGGAELDVTSSNCLPCLPTRRFDDVMDFEDTFFGSNDGLWKFAALETAIPSLAVSFTFA
mmetsp:Transcript_4679/g.10375  ORF Transcript_4679/g.10375 Transcript_4679/m.10375 type:complete len:100 (+) Transcript_4679:1209-1508(+)